MPSHLRFALLPTALLAALLASGAALAGASSSSFTYAPDPALQHAAQHEGRVRRRAATGIVGHVRKNDGAARRLLCSVERSIDR